MVDIGTKPWEPGLVAQCESLDAAHDDTVGDNQADVDRQLFGYFVDIRFEYLIDEDHQRGDHHRESVPLRMLTRSL